MNKRLNSLGVDFQSAVTVGKSGVGYYALGMVTALAKEYPELQIYAHYFNFLGSKKSIDLPKLPNLHYKVSRFIPLKIISLIRRCGIELPFEFLLKRSCDAYFFPNFLSYPLLRNRSLITTIHDLAYIDLPETVSEKNRSDLTKFVPCSIKRSDFIATVSEDARKRINSVYRNTVPVVFSTYSPPSLGSDTYPKLEQNIYGEYILFVGNKEPRKNLQKLLEAYSLLPETIKKKYALLLVGGSGWNNTQLAEQIEELKKRGNSIITPGYVTEEELAGIYEYASLFVFPSLYEGYGIPLLEAMSFNTPVVASNIPVIKEVCEDAAVYFNPSDAQDIARVISETLSNTSALKDLRVNGKKRLANITWKKAADTLYEKLLEKVR